MTEATVRSMPWTPRFHLDHGAKTVSISFPGVGCPLADTESLSKAVNSAIQEVIDAAIASNLFPVLSGRHSEHYRIVGAPYFCCLERFAASLFGIAARGAHLTAYVRTSAGIKVWVAKRSPTLFTYPGMLDTTVAGGVKSDHEPVECVLDEADEEASLPSDFVRENVEAVGVVTYVSRKRNATQISSILYVYDIELPGTMTPAPKDGEVEEFMLMSVEEIKVAMFAGRFKPNCNLVMIDFFIRHGIITQENEGDYVEIITRLHRQLPVPVALPRAQKITQ
jgi:isopentenyldiphosphate isomerase